MHCPSPCLPVVPHSLCCCAIQIDLSAHIYFACALLRNTTVVCWGADSPEHPVPVFSGTGYKQLMVSIKLSS